MFSKQCKHRLVGIVNLEAQFLVDYAVINYTTEFDSGIYVILLFISGI